MNSQGGSNVNISDKSVNNIGGNIAGNIITGDNARAKISSPEIHSTEQGKPRVFSSFILPAIIIAIGTVLATLLVLLWPK